MEESKTLILVAIVAIVAISMLVIGTKKQTAPYPNEAETKDTAGQAYTTITPPPDPDPHTSDCPTPKDEYCPLPIGKGSSPVGPSAAGAIVAAMKECEGLYESCKVKENAELADNTKTCEIQNKPCKLSKKNTDKPCKIESCVRYSGIDRCFYTEFQLDGQPTGPGQCSPSTDASHWDCWARGNYVWTYPDPRCSK